MIALIAALILGQSDKLGDPAPRVNVKLGDPFEARAMPLTWRVRRAVIEVKPKADPPIGAGAMPPPGVPERVDLAPVLTRLDAIDARLAEVLAKVDAPARLAPARTPAAATAPPPSVHVLTDRFGHAWDDSLSGYQGLVDHVARVNATPDPVVAPAVAYPTWPSFALPQFGGFSAGGMCGPGGCAPAGGLFGRFR